MEFNSKAERAAAMYAFIVENANAGRTVILATPLRATAIKAKHLPMVRVKGDALQVQSGKNWLDYTYTALSAR